MGEENEIISEKEHCAMCNKSLDNKRYAEVHCHCLDANHKYAEAFFGRNFCMDCLQIIIDCINDNKKVEVE